MTSFDLDFLLKTGFPDSVSLGLGLQHVNLGTQFSPQQHAPFVPRDTGLLSALGAGWAGGPHCPGCLGSLGAGPSWAGGLGGPGQGWAVSLCGQSESGQLLTPSSSAVFF